MSESCLRSRSQTELLATFGLEAISGPQSMHPQLAWSGMKPELIRGWGWRYRVVYGTPDCGPLLAYGHCM